MPQWSFISAVFDVDITEPGVAADWVDELEVDEALPPGGAHNIFTYFGRHSASREVRIGQVTPSVKSLLQGYYENHTVGNLTDDKGDTRRAVIQTFRSRRSDPAATRYDIDVVFRARP